MDQFEAAPEYLFDSVEQVHLDRWHDGRVVLLGDAAWCPTLYSGMGASSGLAGADLLGTLLERHGHDVPAALADWERRLRPFMAVHLERGRANRAFFTPETRRELAVPRVLQRVRRVPVLGPLLGNLQARRMAQLNVADLAA